MNREQARIYSKLTPEEVKVLVPYFNVECFDIMCKWAEGYDVNYVGWKGGLKLSFAEDLGSYKVVESIHIINGVECPAPYDVEPDSKLSLVVLGVLLYAQFEHSTDLLSPI